jgi:hypothetical protein
VSADAEVLLYVYNTQQVSQWSLYLNGRHIAMVTLIHRDHAVWTGGGQQRPAGTMMPGISPDRYIPRVGRAN